MTMRVYCADEERRRSVQKHIKMHSLIAGSELVVIKPAGHLPLLEQPKETTAALGRWMEE